MEQTINKDKIIKAIEKFKKEAITILPDNNSMKCPFQVSKEGYFNNCYLDRCMAFCSDGTTFWCAKLVSKNKNKVAK